MVQIQVAAVDQAEQILTVMVAAFEQFRHVLNPPSGVFRESAENIRHKLTSGGGFVACDGLATVGIVLYQPYADYMYLGRLGVLPAFRGRHIASQLIAAVEQAALERQLSCVQLGVRSALTDNQRLFQHLGYQITGYHSHDGYSEITYMTMEKRLS